MNMLFNLFHLVNTYGVFGSIDRICREVVVEDTRKDSYRKADKSGRNTSSKINHRAVRRLLRQRVHYTSTTGSPDGVRYRPTGYAQTWLKPFLQRLLQERSDSGVSILA